MAKKEDDTGAYAVPNWMSIDDFPDLFSLPPYPQSYEVSLGEERGMPHFKFNAVGSVELYDDPLGHPVLTLTPDDAETVGAIFAHLERNREKWQATANQRKQEKTKKIEAPPEEANQAVLPGPAVSGQGKVKQFALSAG